MVRGCIFQLPNAPHFIGFWGDGEGLMSQISSVVSPDMRPQPNISIAAGYGVTDRHQADAWVETSPEQLVMGRESFGRVPLYWMQQEKTIWFASQLQLLLPLQERSISVPAAYGYSCFSYVPNPLTPVEGIFTVPAGTEQVWHCEELRDQPQSIRLQEWREADELITDESLAVSELKALLKNTIDRQISDLSSSEPVGVLLSGGLDSSVVAALLVQAGLKVRGYTLDFGDAVNSEVPYAEQVAQHLKIPLVKVDASAKRVKQALISTVKALDLPFGDSVTVPLYLLCQAASEDVQVIFNGEGGDQLFAGWTNKPLIAAGLYRSFQPESAEAQLDEFTQQYLRTFHRLWGYESQVYQPQVCAEIQSIQPADWIQDALDPSYSTELLQRLRRATIMLKGAQNIHPRATALAWEQGLKVRSPFCCRELADWTFRLSGSLTLQGSCEKYILKRAVENWLPSDIVWREKRGMGVPLTSRCFNKWWSSLGHWLNPAKLRAANLWKPDIAEQIVSGTLGAHIQGRRIGETLWLLMMWEMWRSQVLGDREVKPSWDHPFWVPRRIWSYCRRWQE
jgi:asparagine synthase (glutamine-hydrolysing)